MLRTISYLCVPNFDSASPSMPKLYFPNSGGEGGETTVFAKGFGNNPTLDVRLEIQFTIIY